MATLDDTSQTGNLSITDNVNNDNRVFQTFNHSYASGNSTIPIVRAGGGFYQWEMTHTGSANWPTCSINYYVVCPVQRSGSGNQYANIDITGDHRGAGGGYHEHYRLRFSGAGDACAVHVESIINNQNRFRVLRMESNGTLTEYSFATGTRTLINISSGSFNAPLFFKIYTSCGSTKVWDFKIRSSGSSFFPPYKGPYQLSFNTNPTLSQYT